MTYSTSWKRLSNVCKLTTCGVLFPVLLLLMTPTQSAQAEFRAGAAVVDVTPDQLPVLVNGGMTSRSISDVNTRVNARSLALSSGETTCVIVVTDSCMMPRDLLDDAKALAEKSTGIPRNQILISATHTHSAPSCMGALGTDADPNYVPFLRRKLVEAIEQAVANLQPAQIGFGNVDAPELTALRRWIRRPDRLELDPFGNPTGRANMHAGRNWDDVTGESGPEDPQLSMISVRTANGDPLAVLANFSMHYYSDKGISADYFGRFCEAMKSRLAPNGPFVAILSHGCSGDIWRRDYTDPDSWDADQTIDQYVALFLERAMQAYETISYKADADLAMAERRLTLNYRVPDLQRLEWAQKIVDQMGDRLPQSKEEIYAREQLILHERQQTEIVIQALRIGEFGITTTPNETYAITGLKIKAASPLEQTMVIELANGGDGYIPPPEQHLFGGYNTWAARSAGLEVLAESKITETCISLLEQVTGKPRKEVSLPLGPASQAIGALKPAVWYRLNELAGPRALDQTGNERDAIYESTVTFGLEGPHSSKFCDGETKNRAPMFVAGRLLSRVPDFKNQYSISMWIWNGMPTDAREITGWFLSQGSDFGLSPAASHVGLAGVGDHPGRLVFQYGSGDRLYGQTEIPRWSWHQVTYVRDGNQIQFYLDGKLEIDAAATIESWSDLNTFYFGGRSDRQDGWEGRLDEIAVFDRPLKPAEIATLTAQSAPPKTALESIESTRGGRHWVDAETDPPRSPEESLSRFQIEPGARIELFAAEPLVKDPVAIAFDATGRMYVAEYSDYPVGKETGEGYLSRIVILDDDDGDGKADRRTVFADGVRYVHNLMPFRGGILVGAQTSILLLVDTDGDDKADRADELFTGFFPAHPQMQIGNPRWGHDNWIYLNYAAPDSDGKIRKGKDWSRYWTDTANRIPDEMPMPRGEFRFHPVTGAYGPATGLGQYGNTIDAWGNRYYARNRNPIVTQALPYEISKRNPYAVISSADYDVAPAGEQTRVFPLVAMKSNYLSHAGTHTAACGTTAYVGDLFGTSDYLQSVFVCEPIGHLVTRSIVEYEPESVVLKTRRPQPDQDFLASTDTWFRPSSLETGPDGALYLADMYRLWVEHPKFLPEDIAAKLDWRAGEDRGRIWRIVPADKPAPKIAVESSPVELLQSTNGWKRTLGQRLLVESQDQLQQPALVKILQTSKNPLVRLQTFCTLEGLDLADDQTLQLALRDTDPHVRAAGVQVVAAELAQNPALFTLIDPLHDDPAVLVRFQVALACGEIASEKAFAVLSAVAVLDGHRPWFPQAILSSSRDCSAEVLQSLVTASSGKQNGALLSDLAAVVGARGDEAELHSLLKLFSQQSSASPATRKLVVIGLADGLTRHRGAMGRTSLQKLLQQPPASLAVELKPVAELLQKSRETALDSQQSLEDRLAAVSLLGYQSAEDVVAVADVLFRPGQPTALQSAALQTLRKMNPPGLGDILLKHWRSFGPQMRSDVTSLMLSRSNTALQILTAMDAGQVNPAVIDIDGRVRLLKHADAQIRTMAEKLLGGAVSENRQEVVSQYEPALQLNASRESGAEVFKRSCQKCHRIDGQGSQVGPDLSDVRNRSREALLYDILDPNRKLEPQYTAYSITTLDGRVYSGLMVSETEAAIVLRQAEGKEQSIARSEIDEMVASGRSLMPEGFEKTINPQQMADLMTYLNSLKSP
ncbi:MAG: c-type cytochrome [Planctomycetaceae bacterium]|nr:c-type cytochrome [Planctomycetaceae bacterium]